MQLGKYWDDDVVYSDKLVRWFGLSDLLVCFELAYIFIYYLLYLLYTLFSYFKRTPNAVSKPYLV